MSNSHETTNGQSPRINEIRDLPPVPGLFGTQIGTNTRSAFIDGIANDPTLAIVGLAYMQWIGEKMPGPFKQIMGIMNEMAVKSLSELIETGRSDMQRFEGPSEGIISDVAPAMSPRSRSIANDLVNGRQSGSRSR